MKDEITKHEWVVEKGVWWRRICAHCKTVEFKIRDSSGKNYKYVTRYNIYGDDLIKSQEPQCITRKIEKK